MADCAFCDIIAGRLAASIVAEDEHTLAIVDLRQFHTGHVLVIPRAHLGDIRDADDVVAAAVFCMTARIARAVAHAFPPDGLSIWHSAGPGANQEVPHLHVHVHPRFMHDELLKVYPRPPECPPRTALEQCATRLREALTATGGSV